MRKYQKKLVILTAVGALTVGSLSVSAAGLRDVFDAKYYADTYEDLKKAYGYDEEALFNHYVTWGLTEGRSMNPVFDVQAYRNAYGDLNEAFGEDWDAYVNHYFAYGMKEGRNSGILFDPVAYAEAYPDIKEAFGDDYAAILRHYLTYGIQEGRTAGVTVKEEPQVQNISTPAETTPAETAPAETTPTDGEEAEKIDYYILELENGWDIKYSFVCDKDWIVDSDEYGINYASFREGQNANAVQMVKECLSEDSYTTSLVSKYGEKTFFITCASDLYEADEKVPYTWVRHEYENGDVWLWVFVDGTGDSNEIAARYYSFFEEIYGNADAFEWTFLSKSDAYIALFDWKKEDISDQQYSLSASIQRNPDFMISIERLKELKKDEVYSVDGKEFIYQGYLNIAGEGQECYANVFTSEEKTYVVIPQAQNYSDYTCVYGETSREQGYNSYISDVLSNLFYPIMNSIKGSDTCMVIGVKEMHCSRYFEFEKN